jgi:hypothetical protein
MTRAEIITNGIDPKYGGYYCPWQSITLIEYKVDGALRHDGIYTSKELLSLPLKEIFNDHLKMEYMRLLQRRRVSKLYTPQRAIDPGKLNYDGWQVTMHTHFRMPGAKHMTGTFKEGYAIATKQVKVKDGSGQEIGLDLHAVSIAIFNSSQDF